MVDGGHRGPGTEHQDLGERVGTETIGAVHADTGALTGGEEPRQGSHRVGVGVDPAHHVMDDGADRYRLLHRVDADIAHRQLPNHRDLAVDRRLSQVADVKVDIIAVWALEGSAGLPFLDECLGETIPGAELHGSLLWMVGIAEVEGLTQVVVLQITPALSVDHDPTLAPGRLSDQDAGAGEAGRVVLDELHVLERHPCPVGQRHAVAGLDAAVGGEWVDPSRSAGA